MNQLQIILIGVYTACLLYMTLFSMVQLNLLKAYRRQKKNKQILPALQPGDHHPLVTVQLPIFNELYVVDRLLDNITKLDYPKDKLQIQVLDDSTDETVGHAAKKLKSTKHLDLTLFISTAPTDKATKPAH